MNKILIGPLKRHSENILESYEILGTFFTDSSILVFNPTDFYKNTEKSIMDIIEELANSEELEYIIIWGIDNDIIPDKIENTKYKIIGVLFDIKNSFESTIANIDRFDYIITDENSKKILNRIGYENIISLPLRAKSSVYENFTPFDFKDKDICFLGNYANCLEEKSNILLKISSLSDKYNIIFCDNKYLEDYSDIIRKSKIVVNFSDNNIASLSCFEIMSSGSLLFTDNNTIDLQENFIDKIDCIYYNEDNILDFLKYYLSNIDKAIEISNNAYKKVSNFDYDKVFLDIINKIKELEFKRKRNFSKKKDTDKKLAIALQSLQSNNESKYIKIEKEIKEILEKDENNIEAINNLAVLYAQAYFNFSYSKDKNLLIQIRNLFEKTISLYPEYVLARMNLAIIEYREGNYEIVEKLLNEIILTIVNLPENSLKYKGFYFTSKNLFENDIFKLEWEKSLYQLYNSKEELNFALNDLILAKSFDILGNIYKKQNLYENAEEMYNSSLSIVDKGFEETKYNFSYILYKLNKYDNAIENINSFLLNNPFDFNSLFLLSDIYKEINNIEKYININNKIINYSKSIQNTEIYLNNAKDNIKDHLLED